MKKIAIIGFGRFGQLLTKLLLAHTDFEVLVISSRPHPNQDRVVFGQLDDLKTVDAVIPVVPISAFEATINDISPYLAPGCICIDVCSVKTYPVQVMLEKLPASVSILATHPMFGPDSVERNNGLKGLGLVLYPVRITPNLFRQIFQFCQKIGLEVTELSPDEHDKYVAYSQLYTFCIGQLTNQMKLSRTPIDTYWYSFFLDQSQVVTKDGERLFRDLVTFNPYAQEFLIALKKSFTSVLEILEPNQNHDSSSRS